MVVESIKSTIRTMYDSVLMRNYITVVDDKGKKTLEIVEYSYKLYDKVGKIQTDHHKGAHIDKKV